jgi:hypothetical protein
MICLASVDVAKANGNVVKQIEIRGSNDQLEKLQSSIKLLSKNISIRREDRHFYYESLSH